AFFYNNLYELTAETHPDFGTISYQLDANGNRSRKTTASSVDYYGYDNQNKLLWSNQAGSFAPTPNQSQPYRIYQDDFNGRPTQLDHQDAVTGGVSHDRYDWDGMGKLRRILCVGTENERYTATYNGGGNRVSSTLNGMAHQYSYGAGLLYDAADNTVYTPGI